MKTAFTTMELSKEDIKFIVDHHGGPAKLTRKLGLPYTSRKRSRIVDNWLQMANIPLPWRTNLERLDPAPFVELFKQKLLNGEIEDSNSTHKDYKT